MKAETPINFLLISAGLHHRRDTYLNVSGTGYFTRNGGACRESSIIKDALKSIENGLTGELLWTEDAQVALEDFLDSLQVVGSRIRVTTPHGRIWELWPLLDINEAPRLRQQRLNIVKARGQRVFELLFESGTVTRLVLLRMPHKIFRVARTDPIDYDETRSIIVAASDEAEARGSFRTFIPHSWAAPMTGDGVNQAIHGLTPEGRSRRKDRLEEHRHNEAEDQRQKEVLRQFAMADIMPSNCRTYGEINQILTDAEEGPSRAYDPKGRTGGPSFPVTANEGALSRACAECSTYPAAPDLPQGRPMGQLAADAADGLPREISPPTSEDFSDMSSGELSESDSEVDGWFDYRDTLEIVELGDALPTVFGVLDFK